MELPEARSDPEGSRLSTARAGTSGAFIAAAGESFECILVVDDDASMRSLIRGALAPISQAGQTFRQMDLGLCVRAQYRVRLVDELHDLDEALAATQQTRSALHGFLPPNVIRVREALIES
jgi:hypothetical protein